VINYSLALAVFTALALDLYTFGDICTELYSNQFSVLNLKKWTTYCGSVLIWQYCNSLVLWIIARLTVIGHVPFQEPTVLGHADSLGNMPVHRVAAPLDGHIKRLCFVQQQNLTSTTVLSVLLK